MSEASRPLLDVAGLRVSYRTRAGVARAVDAVSFQLTRGETLGLVGESGCGKTTVGRAIVRVLPANARIEGGSVRFEGRDLVTLPEEDLRRVRWRDIAIVPQSAMNALNPVFRVGRQIEEVVIEHEGVSRAEARRRTRDLFGLVKIDPARTEDYPHQFSGGMRQRVLVAMALALGPSLLIADEPTTALDVITQDRVFTRIRQLQRRVHASMLLVTHDMGLVAENCDRVAVMYAGKIVEYGETGRLFTEPVHPYTLGLKNAFPSTTRPRDQALISIPGAPPSLLAPPDGCRFAPRCPFATALCREVEPPLVAVGARHLAACHHAGRAEEMRGRAAEGTTWASIR
ncbi:MAG: ABC transporter ATP-binding protein [Candidatus Rokuibacteriota bacterium]